MTGLNYSILQCLLYSAGGLIIFLAAIFIGTFLYNIRFSNAVKTHFVNGFLGIFTIIAVYSIIHTGIQTINLVALPVLAYLCIRNKNRFELPVIFTSSLKPLLYIFPITFVLYGSFSLPVSIENDARFYAKIVYALGHFKSENLFHFYNQYDQSFHGIMPYHYSELWLASLFSRLLGLKAIIALKYVTYPTLIAGTCYGVLGFVTKHRFLLFLLFLALSTLPLYALNFSRNGFPVYTDFWVRPNFIAYYFSFVPVVFLLAEGRLRELFPVAILVATSSVILIPCLFGALFLFSALKTLGKKIAAKEFFLLNASLVVATMLMAFLYWRYAPETNLLISKPIGEILKATLKIWKAVIFTSATITLEASLLLVLAFLANKYLVKDEKFRDILIFVFAQLLVGVIIFQAFNSLDNAYQFAYFAFAAIGLSLIVILMRSAEHLLKGQAGILMVAAFIFACFFFTPVTFKLNEALLSLEEKNLQKAVSDEKWLNEVAQYLSAHPQSKGGFVLSKGDLPEYHPKTRNCLTYQLGSFVCYITDNCNLPDLTHRDTLLYDKVPGNIKLFEKAESWMNAFPRFKNEPDPVTFIKNDEVDYFICTHHKKIEDPDLLVITSKEDGYTLVGRK